MSNEWEMDVDLHAKVNDDNVTVGVIGAVENILSVSSSASRMWMVRGLFNFTASLSSCYEFLMPGVQTKGIFITRLTLEDY